METEKIKKIVDDAIQNNGSEYSLADNWNFNQKETINTITLYAASKFKSGDYDPYTKQKKYFFNIVNSACINVTKNIDIDTKNINVRSRKNKDRYRAMIWNEKLRQYMQTSGFSILLNKAAESLPKYGSIIWKNEAGQIKQLNLNDCLFDPGVNSIDNDFNIRSYYFIEKHYVQPIELEKMVKKGWNKEAVKNVLNAFRKKKLNNEKLSDILVYEMHVELPASYITEGGSEDDYSFYRVYAVFDANETNGRVTLGVNEILFSNKEKELPYMKLDYSTLDKRALGLGVIEVLFDTQMRMNEMKNQKSVSMLLGSKTIFTTADETVEKNVIKDVLNGDIIKSRNGLSPVQTDTKNLGAYQQEEISWEANGRALTNRFEALTGEQMKTNTPYKSLQRLNIEGAKYFDFVRENFGLFIREALTKWVIPEMKKSMKIDDVFEVFTPEVVRALYEMELNSQIDKATISTIVNYGIFPSEQDKAIAKQKWMQKQPKQLSVKVTEDLFKFDYTLEIDITGESYIDNLDNKMSMIQSLSQNAQALQDPNVKRLYDSASEDMGIDKNLVTF